MPNKTPANRLWSFKTKNFLVVCDAEDDSFDGMHMDKEFVKEIDEKLADGTYTCFCARVAVHWNGLCVAEEFLGECVYSDPRTFRSIADGYFHGMVRQACRMARDRILILIDQTRLRNTRHSIATSTHREV